jgi:spore maturation protein CgeB
MKILIANDGYTAPYYERLGLSRAFVACGHEVIMYDIDKKSTYDMFDDFEPDIFLGQTYNTNKSIIKCIEERPHLKVAMKTTEWREDSTRGLIREYPISHVDEHEKFIMRELKDKTGGPEFLYINYHPDYIEETHSGWIRNGFNVKSLLLGADVFDYTRGKEVPAFKSDITFVGGYWKYKARTLDKYIIPLCKESLKYNIKIFGNQPWGVSQYYGFVDNKYIKDIFKSANICPNIHEKHSQDLGYDIVERPFKLMSNKCFVISDYVEGLRKLYNEDQLVMAKDPEEFLHLVRFFTEYPEETKKYIDEGYKETILNHTYFERISDIFRGFGLSSEIKEIENAKAKTFKELNI